MNKFHSPKANEGIKKVRIHSSDTNNGIEMSKTLSFW